MVGVEEGTGWVLSSLKDSEEERDTRGGCGAKICEKTTELLREGEGLCARDEGSPISAFTSPDCFLARDRATFLMELNALDALYFRVFECFKAGSDIEDEGAGGSY